MTKLDYIPRYQVGQTVRWNGLAERWEVSDTFGMDAPFQFILHEAALAFCGVMNALYAPRIEG